MKITGNSMFSLLMATRNQRNPLLANKIASKIKGSGTQTKQSPLSPASAVSISGAQGNPKTDTQAASTMPHLPHSTMHPAGFPVFWMNSPVRALDRDRLIKELTGFDRNDWDMHPRAEYANKLADAVSGSGTESIMESMSRKYAELREGILERYKDDDTEMHRQLEELNMAFEFKLKMSTAQLNLGPARWIIAPAWMTPEEKENWHEYNRAKRDVMLFGTDADRALMRQEFDAQINARHQYQQNMRALMEAFNRSMMGHMDIFFEAFINNIKTNDFDKAFAESMALLSGGQSTSLNDMSFHDASKLREAFAGRNMFFDDGGESRTALNSIINDTSISLVIRQAIAARFGS